MIIQPKVWGFICTTAHPLGCELNVRDQVARVRQAPGQASVPKTALIIGASTGYGLAARITAAFVYGAATLGVFLEKPGRVTKSASAGWYNAAAFHQFATRAGLPCVSINGDAFAAATRARAIDAIKRELGGQVDLVIYSLAAPLRRLPDAGPARTALKPIGAPFTAKTIDTDHDRVTEVTVPPAGDDEIRDTVAVMGGENWSQWLAALDDAEVLAPDATTVAYSYIGPEITWPIYWHGTLGQAKKDLENTARALRTQYAARGLNAGVAIMKSVVTQASAAIPAMPLYLSVVQRILRTRELA
ncbi:MAG: enoyl-[acyl-carrier-protein] reductase FabV, partial [Gammaproteobacteria bacterium]|nr:enoyl-[acyl-carrier-protein] reductase FabV [Gammaproteobacteria bacterium]